MKYTFKTYWVAWFSRGAKSDSTLFFLELVEWCSCHVQMPVMELLLSFVSQLKRTIRVMCGCLVCMVVDSSHAGGLCKGDELVINDEHPEKNPDTCGCVFWANFTIFCQLTTVHQLLQCTHSLTFIYGRVRLRNIKQLRY